MLGGMFFGDYKKVRTRYKKEKDKKFSPEEKNNLPSCAGCAGSDCCR